MNQPWDVLVIGAGPAGLTAAMYLARYRRRVLVVHDGTSRALRIPRTHNVAGFPAGVTGVDLIDRMRRHAETYGAAIELAEVQAVRRGGPGFIAGSGSGSIWEARSIIFATGVWMNEVDLPFPAHELAMRDSVLRYCPVCDGYEATGRRIGVLGCDSNGAAEALFLTGFSPEVILLPLSHPDLDGDERRALEAAGVRVVAGALDALRPGPNGMSMILRNGHVVEVDILYPALGLRPRNELPLMLGLSANETGCVRADAPFGGEIPGVFAAGDVVEGLDQINVAAGHGTIAATRAHNYLRELDGERL